MHVRAANADSVDADQNFIVGWVRLGLIKPFELVRVGVDERFHGLRFAIWSPSANSGLADQYGRIACSPWRNLGWNSVADIFSGVLQVGLGGAKSDGAA